MVWIGSYFSERLGLGGLGSLGLSSSPASLAALDRLGQSSNKGQGRQGEKARMFFSEGCRRGFSNKPPQWFSILNFINALSGEDYGEWRHVNTLSSFQPQRSIVVVKPKKKGWRGVLLYLCHRRRSALRCLRCG